MKIFKIIIVSIILSSQAIADDLRNTSAIANSGARFQAARLKIATENIANKDSTGIKPGEDAYRRKIIFAENKFDKKLGTKIVKIRKISFDKSDFIIKFAPSHPAADKDGYVKLPNIMEEIERVDAVEAKRGYEANLGVLEITGNLIQKTIDAIGR